MSQAPSPLGPTEAEPKETRRPYTPPQVQRVELRPEEAVLGACKNRTAGAGPRQPSSCRAVAACSALGS